jgi:hypothetical protein
MAVKIPKSARFTLTLNTGTNLVTGAIIKKSVSFGNLIPDCNEGAVSAVANAIGALLPNPVMAVSITENYQLN